MTIEKYIELTGCSLTPSAKVRIEAQLARAQSIVENLLGYTLSKTKSSKNYYEEAGKSASDFDIPDSDDDLLPPDDVVSAYRLYPYNPHDEYISTDPFTQLNAVKLVYVRKGVTPNGITLKTFDTDELRVEVGQGGIMKYIQLHQDCWCPQLATLHQECVQIAVDAAWLYDECIPTELEFAIADIATYYGNPKRGIKSQTLATHSYTMFDNVPVESQKETIAMLKKYAGPFGSLHVEPA